MKKKLIVLSSIVMFSIGLALYANNSSAMKVLSEDNIEALTDVESPICLIQETGTYPHRVWIDHKTHTITLEGYYKESTIEGEYECFEKTGRLCTTSTSEPISNAERIAEMVMKFLKTIFGEESIISWVCSLFK